MRPPLKIYQQVCFVTQYLANSTETANAEKATACQAFIAVLNVLLSDAKKRYNQRISNGTGEEEGEGGEGGSNDSGNGANNGSTDDNGSGNGGSTSGNTGSNNGNSSSGSGSSESSDNSDHSESSGDTNTTDPNKPSDSGVVNGDEVSF